MLIGNVGADPDVRYVDSDVAVASVRLATTERGYTMPNGTVVPDRTDWHNLVLWRGLAKVVEQYVHKGDKLYVEGKLHTRSYDDNQRIKRYVTEIYVDNMEMLTSKSSSTNVHQEDHLHESNNTSSAAGNAESGEVPF